MKNILLLLLAILIYSCSSYKNNLIIQYDLNSDKNIILNNGKCLEITDTAYKICLKSIKDSRCPTGVNCIWEGDAVVLFNFQSKTEKKSFELHTARNLKQDIIINNLRIKLINVFPYPVAKIPTNQKDYSVEFSVSEQ
jgi:hypothetical protein